MRLLITLFLLTLATPPAFATDGVLEISQTCAVQTGCFAGDLAGWPVTIDGSAGGSYRLTGDLSVTGANQTVVHITADHVTLDLNGFAVSCLFVFTPCAGNGTGVGIDAASAGNVTVRNGTVRGLGGAAILTGSGGFVERVRAIANGSGIDVTSGTIQDCHADSNLAHGMRAFLTIVRDSYARSNNVGILCGATVISKCTMTGNLLTFNASNPWLGSTHSLGDNAACESQGDSCFTF